MIIGKKLMNNLSDRQKEQLAYLLGDFNAIKVEIARRSTLQRVVLAAYLAALTCIVKGAFGLGSPLMLIMLTAIWVASALALLFYFREGLEITRLGRIAKDRIAPVAAGIMEVDPSEILPSETHQSFPELSRLTRPYNMQFRWLIFFMLPLLLTVFVAFRKLDQLNSLLKFTTVTPWALMFGLFFMIWTVVLLKRHA